MAKPSITDLIGVGDFMVSNLWDISITRSTNSILGSVPGTFGGTVINLQAVSFEIPKRTGTSLEVTVRGHKIKQPGAYAYSNEVTLALVEDENNKLAHNMIKEWRDAIIEVKSDDLAKKADVVATIEVKRLNRDGTASGLSWKLYQCYLESYELGELNEEGSVIQPTITFSYDWFEDFIVTTEPEPKPTEIPVDNLG